MQLALSLYAAEQTLIECPQGRHMQPGTGLGQGAVRDQNIGADSPQAGEEGVKRALDAATAKAQQGRQECGQWQLARAGEGVGMIGTAGQIGKGRAVQVIAKIGQKRLCKFTVLRQKSCQPQKKIKQNQRLADCSSLSSVDWVVARWSKVPLLEWLNDESLVPVLAYIEIRKCHLSVLEYLTRDLVYCRSTALELP
ncbi:MAG TPA: hypothetical protein PKI72_16075 [Giesbergeria sp.]|nr:hypothetical protein [Giesbergeria sp.]